MNITTSKLHLIANRKGSETITIPINAERRSESRTDAPRKTHRRRSQLAQDDSPSLTRTEMTPIICAEADRQLTSTQPDSHPLSSLRETVTINSLFLFFSDENRLFFALTTVSLLVRIPTILRSSLAQLVPIPFRDKNAGSDETGSTYLIGPI